MGPALLSLPGQTDRCGRPPDAHLPPQSPLTTGLMLPTLNSRKREALQERTRAGAHLRPQPGAAGQTAQARSYGELEQNKGTLPCSSGLQWGKESDGRGATRKGLLLCKLPGLPTTVPTGVLLQLGHHRSMGARTPRTAIKDKVPV